MANASTKNESKKVKRAIARNSGKKPTGTRKATKRRGAGIQHLSVGSDLLTSISAERRQQREAQATRAYASATPFKERFVNSFASWVIADAKNFNWSPQTRRQAGAYIKSLTEGDGSAPDNLRGKPLERVQRHFAFTCAKMNPKPDSFAGQSQDWFPDALAKAHKVLADRRSRAASSMTTMASTSSVPA